MNNNYSNNNRNHSKNQSRNNQKGHYKGSNRYNQRNNQSGQGLPHQSAPPMSDAAVVGHAVKTGQNNPNHRHFNPNHRPRRYHNNRYQNNDRGMSLEKTLSRYNYLLELHLQARKKYFENIYQSNERIIIKFQQNYNQTLLDIQKFLSELNDSQKKYLDEKLNLYPEDNTYSSNHNLDPRGEKSLEDYQVKDPHHLPSQKDLNFSQDKEESVGTLEDYQKIKELY